MGGFREELWHRTVTRCAVQIRSGFGVPDQATEERIVRAFRAALRPRKKAGRKPDEATARAAEMWNAGMESAGSRSNQRALWQRIYREVFPDFQRMDRLTRQHRTHTLRRNVKAYLRRQGRKSARGIHVTTRMRARKRVLSPPLTVPAE
jgi:hypothetical protein